MIRIPSADTLASADALSLIAGETTEVREADVPSFVVSIIAS